MANMIGASGYSQLKDTPLGRGIVYAGTLIDRNFEDDFLPFITNNTVLNELTKCGQVVTFSKPPRVGGWHPYELNQELKFDQARAGSGCLSICHAAYKAMKYDKLDIRNMCEDWASFEEGFLEDVWKELSNLWHETVIYDMIASVPHRNQGNNAGRYRNINLGTLTNPLHLTPDNLVDFFASMQRLMRDNGRLNRGEMFMLGPDLIETQLLTTAWEKMLCCNIADSILFNGLVADNIMGYRVIQTDRLTPWAHPVQKRNVWPIIFGWRDAYAFTGDIVEAELGELERSFGVTYKMLSVYGGGTMYPEALGVAYVTFSAEGELPD